MVVFQVVFFLLGETLAQSSCLKRASGKAGYRIGGCLASLSQAIFLGFLDVIYFMSQLPGT